jgi:L-ascorbate metabolism protein UlaG (beta-lactamase superfamily)
MRRPLKMAVSVTWMAHATFKVTDGALIYIDPWKLQVEDRADIVLITHATVTIALPRT